MNNGIDQGELFGLIWKPYQQKYRLRVNDLIRMGDRLGRVIRINDCAAVVLINQPTRQFVTRWDKAVRFNSPPLLVRISVNSETEIITETVREQKKRKQRH